MSRVRERRRRTHPSLAPPAVAEVARPDLASTTPRIIAWTAPMVAVALPFLAYLVTLAPSITWRNGGMDSADTATGVVLLSTIHPPGYPLFVLLGHLFLRLPVPLEPAGRVSLYCAVLAAAAAGILFWTCREHLAGLAARPNAAIGQARRDLVALAATLALALGPLWWQQANLATAHAGNLLLASLLLLIAQRALRRVPSPIETFFGGLVAGLAVSHHLTLIAVPVVAFCVIAIDSANRRPRLRREIATPRRLLLAATGVVLGLSPWLLLPALAASRPAHIWGDATTAAGWLDVAFARQYHEILTYPTVRALVTRAATGVWTIARELGPIGFPAALAGLAILWDGRRRDVALVLGLIVLDLAFFARYAARDVESYLLPACLAAAPAAAAGLLFAVEHVDAHWRRFGQLALPAGLVGIVAIAAIGLDGARMNLARDREAIDYARGALAEAPPNALILAETDRHTFPLWYGHLALGLRPDVAVVDRWMLRWDWYRAHVARLYPDLHLPAGPPSGPPLAAGLYTERPVVVTEPDSAWGTAIERGEFVHRLRPAR